MVPGDGDGAAASTGRPAIQQTLELETYLHSAREGGPYYGHRLKIGMLVCKDHKGWAIW